METVQKARTPSRCREWERQRRNKFNEAITRLGEVVKEINRADDSTGKDNENVQYPKIEIVQKAIICLTNCAQEKTKFKAEILALHVQLEAAKKKPVTTEVSTQVYLDSSKRTQKHFRSKDSSVERDVLKGAIAADSDLNGVHLAYQSSQRKMTHACRDNLS